MTWKPQTANYAAANRPLHAGVCVDLLRGNLLHVATENAVDYCIGPPSNPGYATSWGAIDMQPSTWRRVKLGPVPIWIRPLDGEPLPRSVVVSIHASLAITGEMSGSPTTTVRAYLRRSRDESAYATGFPGEGSWGSVAFSDVGWTWYDITVSHPEPHEPYWPDAYPSDTIDGMMPTADEASLVLIAVCADVGAQVDLRVDAIRIQEGAP